MGNFWITIWDMKMTKLPEFRADRLNELMEKRDMDPGKIEYLADISRSMVHYLQKGAKPNVSAVIVGKLGQVLNCSIDYLLGLTDDPTPPSKKELPADLRELWELYEDLPSYRRRDVLKVVATFAEDDRSELNRQVEEDIKQRLQMIEDFQGPAMADLVADLAPRLSSMLVEWLSSSGRRSITSAETERVNDKVDDA